MNTTDKETNKELILLKKTFLSLLPTLDNNSWDYISTNCSVISYPAKENIIKEGEKQKNIYFLCEGLVRGFYVNHKGEEVSIRFVNNQGWVTHYSSLISQEPSTYNFQTLEQSVLISLPYSIILEGYDKFQELEKFGRLVAESILKTQQKRIESFQFMNAEQRYLQFIEQNPALYNRVSLSYLSSYLGIQRQSLTRIRKKLAGR